MLSWRLDVRKCFAGAVSYQGLFNVLVSSGPHFLRVFGSPPNFPLCRHLCTGWQVWPVPGGYVYSWIASLLRVPYLFRITKIVIFSQSSSASALTPNIPGFSACAVSIADIQSLAGTVTSLVSLVSMLTSCTLNFFILFPFFYYKYTTFFLYLGKPGATIQFSCTADGCSPSWIYGTPHHA